MQRGRYLDRPSGGPWEPVDSSGFKSLLFSVLPSVSPTPAQAQGDDDPEGPPPDPLGGNPVKTRPPGPPGTTFPSGGVGIVVTVTSSLDRNPRVFPDTDRQSCDWDGGTPNTSGPTVTPVHLGGRGDTMGGSRDHDGGVDAVSRRPPWKPPEPSPSPNVKNKF